MNMTVKGDKLYLELDVSKKAIDGAYNSKSGKAKIVYTTGGFKAVDGRPPLRIALNLILPKPKTAGHAGASTQAAGRSNN
jgi:hypothetical protein